MEPPSMLNQISGQPMTGMPRGNSVTSLPPV
jgi:hypothetical protein